jgi:hypothetical protein
MSWAARRTAVLVLIAVFLVGGAAGWVAEEVVDEIHWPGHQHKDKTPDRPDDDEPFDDDAEEDLLETLGQSRAQDDSVDQLLEAREDRLEEYWKSRLPDLQAIVDSSRQEVRAVLTPGQRDAYDRWLGGASGPNRP